MMDETNELNRDVRGRIDAHLDAIDAALSAAGMSRSERRSITDDVEAQVLEMLSSRAGPSPTLADTEAVLAELDPAEAYAREDFAPPPLSAPPAPMPVPPRSRFSRTAILGAIWAGLFFAILVPAAALWSYRSTRVSSRSRLVAAHAQSRRSVEIKEKRPESAITQPSAISPAGATYVQTSAAKPAGARPVKRGLRISIFFGLILFLPAILILGAPVGTTILGLVAISQIRRSAGRLYGLGLALFDAIVFPLLLLDVAIFGLWFVVLQNRVIGRSLALWVILVIAVVTCLIVDFLLVRCAWRSIKKPQPASA
ncbi:MAG: hypothetical protein SVV80_11665 [Planctomycetota bacterium]|nr:hypothetical protein [Planctomycetota bacterium]